MKLSIIVPVHNEERFVGKLLETLEQVSLDCDREVVVVDDGSTDNTPAILNGLKDKINFKLITHSENHGKGEAVRTALKEASGELVIIQDADLEYDPHDIPNLLSAMGEGVWAVYGKRGVKVWPERGFHYVLGAKLLSWLINLLFLARISDAYTGYKLLSVERVGKELLLGLESRGFELEAELTCKILSRGGKIVEVPIHYVPRSRREGKHIGWRDALRGFVAICKYRFLG